MTQLDSILYINVEYNTEDEEYGPVYVATNDIIGLVTEAKSFEELRENLKDALDACLGGIDTVAEYNLIANPLVELKPRFYAD